MAEQKDTILVIDHDADERATLTEATLEPFGYVVRQCATGEEGLKLIKAESPDVLVLDIHLEGLSGRDVLTAIKDGTMLFAIDQQQFLQGYLPVVFLTYYNLYGLMPGGGTYGVSKHGVLSLTESLHRDLKMRGAKIGASSPIGIVPRTRFTAASITAWKIGAAPVMPLEFRSSRRSKLPAHTPTVTSRVNPMVQLSR